jgi:AraC-like DNA-binding protein
VSDALVFSTRRFAPSERFERYHEVYKQSGDAFRLGSPVAAAAKAWRWGEFLCLGRTLTGLGSERRAPRVRRDDFDHIVVQLNVRGEFHVQSADGFKAVQPGEIILLDWAKPTRAVMPDLKLITLAVPRTVFTSAAIDADRLDGVIIPAGPAARLAGALASPTALERETPDAGAVLTGLLRTTLADLGLAEASALEKTDPEKLWATQRFIRDHLLDQALSPDHIARAQGLSRATLYRLFGESGGVQKYIQSQRLAWLKRRLRDPSELRSVGALAYEAGFASEHHANRSFTLEFGEPPGKFRRESQLAAQVRQGGRVGSLHQAIVDWLAKR